MMVKNHGSFSGHRGPAFRGFAGALFDVPPAEASVGQQGGLSAEGPGFFSEENLGTLW